MSDYNFLMESRLQPALLRVVKYLSSVAASHGLNLYLTGGAVRDLTLGQPVIRGLDLVVEGNPQKLLRALESPAGARRRQLEPDPEQDRPEILETHFESRWQSAQVVFAAGVRAKLAMSRRAIYDRPGHRPTISSASIVEDLRGRDFSVNAMAISLHPNSRGLLLDPTNGAADVERRELRALHSRSFYEDPSRIYRLLRLGLRLNFKPDERTERWLSAALADRAWAWLDAEQQGRELAAILAEENCLRVIRLLRERGLLGGLDSKIASVRLAVDRFERTRSVLRLVPGTEPTLLNFYCLAFKASPALRQRLARKIFGQGKTVKLALGLEHEGRKLAQVVSSSKAAQPSFVYNLLSGVEQPVILWVLAQYPQAKVQNRIRNFLLKYPSVRARLPRAELQALGMEPGPKFEKVLQRIFMDQLDGRIRTPQQMQKALHEYAGVKPAVKPAAKPVAKAPPASRALGVRGKSKSKRKARWRRRR